MTRSRISAGLIVAAVLAAAALAVLPPLLLGIGTLWFIAPPLGLLAAAAILLRKNSLLMVAAILAVLAVSIVGVLHPMRLFPSQERKLTATGYFLKGQIFALQGDYTQALAAYEHSERAGLEHPWVAVQRAYCHNFLGRSENAYEIFARLMRDTLLATLDVVHINYALSAMKSGNYKQGEQAFWQALSYNFQPGYCYYQLGVYYRLRNDPTKAEEMMTNAHRLAYNRSQCSSILGSIAESRRDYARAEEFYHRALRENPGNIAVHVKLGSLILRHGRSVDIAVWRNGKRKTFKARLEEMSVRELSASELKALNLSSGVAIAKISHHKLYSVIARSIPSGVKIESWDWEINPKSKRMVKMIVKSSMGTYELEGSALRSASRAFDKELQEGNVILTIEKHKVQNLEGFYRIASEIKSKYVSDAREVLLEGVRVFEWVPFDLRSYAILLNNLGFVYAEEGQLAKAIPAFKQAIRVDPAFMDSYDNLAYIYIENKRFSDAVIVLRRALEVDPGYRPARRVLDQLLAVPETGQP